MPTVRSSGWEAYCRRPSFAIADELTAPEYTMPFQPGKLHELVPKRMSSGRSEAIARASSWTRATAATDGSSATSGARSNSGIWSLMTLASIAHQAKMGKTDVVERTS